MEAENAANPFERKRIDIQSFIDENTRIYVSKAQDQTVRKIAAEIMATGIRLMDACHIACAMLAHCDVFLSTDNRILKYQTKKLHISNPATFIIERGIRQ